MKIGLTGPSGSGKTTLAKFISDKFNLPFVEGSASLTNQPEVQNYLKDLYGYSPNGHKEVINLSNKDPDFGFDFQYLLLKSRIIKLSEIPEFVTDRTMLDNTAYFIMQCSHNQEEATCKKYIESAVKGVSSVGLTHLILIKPNDGWTEENGSRVNNNFFQHYNYAVFINTYERYFKEALKDLGIKVLIISDWDLEYRKVTISNFLNK